MMFRSIGFATGLACLAACADGITSHEPRSLPGFQVTTVTGAVAIDLGALTGARSGALAINDANQIAGWSTLESDHAFLWDGGVAIDLGDLGGGSAGAEALNQAGEVVGSARASIPPGRRAFLWDGAMRDLGTLGGNSVALGINDAPERQVVGFSTTTGSTGRDEQHAFLWTAGAGMQDLHAQVSGGATCSIAFDVNDAGQVVGTNGSAFVWSASDGLTILPPLAPGGYAVAFAINEAGQVVGASETPSGDEHAVLWQGGAPRDLGTLGEPYSAAYAVNDAGHIVGSSSNLTASACREPALVVDPVRQRAFVWVAAALTELPPVVPGAQAEAYGINNANTVVGWSAEVATLWTVDVRPSTPEEETDQLTSDVEGLIADNTLPEGQGGALLAKLDAATQQLNSGNVQAAANLLRSFIAQVEAMVASGQLAADVGDALVAAAQQALDLIGA